MAKEEVGKEIRWFNDGKHWVIKKITWTMHWHLTLCSLLCATINYSLYHSIGSYFVLLCFLLFARTDVWNLKQGLKFLSSSPLPFCLFLPSHPSDLKCRQCFFLPSLWQSTGDKRYRYSRVFGIALHTAYRTFGGKSRLPVTPFTVARCSQDIYSPHLIDILHFLANSHNCIVSSWQRPKYTTPLSMNQSNSN